MFVSSISITMVVLVLLVFFFWLLLVSYPFLTSIFSLLFELSIIISVVIILVASITIPVIAIITTTAELRLARLHLCSGSSWQLVGVGQKPRAQGVAQQHDHQNVGQLTETVEVDQHPCTDVKGCLFYPCFRVPQHPVQETQHLDKRMTQMRATQ